MKKLFNLQSLFMAMLPLLIIGCEPIENRVAKKTVIGLYDELWDYLYSDYVGFDYYNNESIYDDGYQMLKSLDIDMVDTINARINEFVQRMGDPQLVIWSSGISWQYFTDSTHICNSRWIFSCDNEYYSITVNAGYISSCYSTLQSKKTNKKYLYFCPCSQADGNSTGSQKMLEEQMASAKAQNVAGVFVDLRSNAQMSENHMTECLRYFLPKKDTTAFYMQSRKSAKNHYELNAKESYSIQGNGQLCKLPCCVLFEKNTSGYANTMAYVLSGLPNVCSVSMTETGGGGAMVKRVYLGGDENGCLSAAYIPYRLLSNNVVSFNTPLKPTISIPYAEVIRGYYRIDDSILAGLQWLESDTP